MNQDPYESHKGMRVPDGFARPWSRTDRPVVRRVIQPLESFIRLEVGGGALLLVAALAALVWANVSFSGYESFWGTHLELQLGDLRLDEDLRHWINDLLMAGFFFLIALEVKREVLLGALADRRLAAVPIAAALGGMVIPALVYLLINSGGSGTPEGWAIPLATDVAFALAVLATIGNLAPGPLRAFLLTVAIVDDVGTIAIIALVFTDSLSLAWLAAAGGIIAAILIMRRLSVRKLAPYVLAAGALWLAVFESGVHATLAGVVLGLLTPARPFHDPDETGPVIAEQLEEVATSEDAEFDQATMLQAARLSTEAVSPLARMEAAVHPWSAFLILPLFALANAGVPISLSGLSDAVTSPLGLGVILGLIVGKPVGLFLGSYLAVRLSPAQLPEGVSLGSILALGLIAGIGFTVALFISTLALPAELVDEAKVAILFASLLASMLGVCAFVLRSRRRPKR
jgi:NhaA family Na+:H+ antiporter